MGSLEERVAEELVYRAQRKAEDDLLRRAKKAEADSERWHIAAAHADTARMDTERRCAWEKAQLEKAEAERDAYAAALRSKISALEAQIENLMKPIITEAALKGEPNETETIAG
jgi:hypothetical protein